MDCFRLRSSSYGGHVASFAMMDEPSIHDPHRQRADAADEIRIEPLHRPGNFEAQFALQDFLPEDAQLLLRKTIADTAMDSGSEGEMLAYLGTLDDEFVGALDLVLVAIAGDVPHHHLVALGNAAAAKLDV